MHNLAVQIVRFVENYQPGIVACEFSDAFGRCHTLVDKQTMFWFSGEYLDSSSPYPQPGVVRCEVLERWRDDQGRELAHITLEKPDAIESTERLTEFVVLAGQLSAAR